MTDQFSVRSQWGHKNYFKDWCFMNLQPTFLFFTYFVNQITLNQTTLSNLVLWIFEVFVRILLNIILPLNQTLLIFMLYVRKTWMTQSILAISLSRVIFFNLTGFYYSYVRSCSLCEKRTSFCTGPITRKLCGFVHIFRTSFTSLSFLLFSLLSITFFFIPHFLFYFI